MTHENGQKGRLVARILRELLASERFDDLADMTAALKTRLARLKIRVTPAELSDAYAMVASNRALVQLPATVHAVRRGRERLFDAPSLPRYEAAQIYAGLMSRYRAERAQ